MQCFLPDATPQAQTSGQLLLVLAEKTRDILRPSTVLRSSAWPSSRGISSTTGIRLTILLSLC